MSTNFLQEAFQALRLTESDSFELDNAGIKDFADYMSADVQLDDELQVIDPAAETEEDLEKTYIGDTILECIACHELRYCKPDEVVIDEEQGLANIEEPCPLCYNMEGFKIVGTVAPYEDVTIDAPEGTEVKVDGVDVEPAEDEELEEGKSEGGKTMSKDAMRARFAKRFGKTNEGLEDKKAELRKRLMAKKTHAGTDDKEEAIEASQKNPVDTTKSPAGELKEGKKVVRAHLGRKAKEEKIEKEQKSPVDVTAAPVGQLKEAKKRHITVRSEEEDLEDSQRFPVEGTKQEDPRTRAPKKRHIGVNDKKEDIEKEQKNPVDVTAAPAGKLREAAKYKRRKHATINKEEENLEDSQKYPVKSPQPAQSGLKEANITISRAEMARLDKEVEEAGKEVAKYKIPMKQNSAGETEPDFSVVPEEQREAAMKAHDRYVKAVKARPSRSKDIITYTEKLKEGMEDISITTGEEKITIKSTPRTDKEMIVPPAKTDEAPAEEEVVDMDIEEIDEESFDKLGESFLKKVYRNVDSFKTTSVGSSDKELMLEGMISFKSGKKAKTTFVFEAASVSKRGKLRFDGLNENIAKRKGSFKLSASVKDNKLVCESLNYNYAGKDAKSGKSQRLYGTIKNK